MKITARFVAVASLGLSLLATSITPAAAFNAPLPSVKPISDVQQVQYRRDHYGERNWRRHNDRRGYYNGHRGYRSERHGYRRHRDGYWYPFAAFAAGAIIGGAMNAPRPAYAGSSRHVQWCSSRYRTYRAYDNTYVPRAGVRAYCSSPYSR